MRLTLLVILVISFLASSAQTPVAKEERAQANVYYTASDWVNSAKAYQSIAEREPANWNARMRLGISLSSMGKVKEGLKALEEAQKIGNTQQTMYALGSSYALDNQADKAFEWLDKSIVAGFGILSIFDSDSGYGKLKSDSRYAQQRERVLKMEYPCMYDEQARKLDFWVGEWEVKNTQSLPAGHSKIEKIMGDCVILENWISIPPVDYKGTSFNLYSSEKKCWIQTYADNKGSLIEFIDGEYKDNKMVFVTRPDSKNTIIKLILHNLGPNLVRQQFESTSDDGKTWTTTTDLYYNRIK